MRDEMERRDFLAVCGVTGILLSGCLSGSESTSTEGNATRNEANQANYEDGESNTGEEYDEENRDGKESGNEKKSNEKNPRNGKKSEIENGTNTSSSFGFGRWLVNPNEVETNLFNNYSIFMTDYSSLFANIDMLDPRMREAINDSTTRTEQLLGVGSDLIEKAVSWGVCNVLKAPHGVDSVISTLEEYGKTPEKIGERHGYSLYKYDVTYPIMDSDETVTTVLGMNGEYLVTTANVARNMEFSTKSKTVEKTIDTGVGEVGSYAESNQNLKTLIQNLPKGVVLRGKLAYKTRSLPSRFNAGPDIVASGMSWNFGENGADVKEVSVFKKGLTGKESKEWKEMATRNAEDGINVKAEIEGMVGAVNYTLPYGEMRDIFYPRGRSAE